MGNYRDRVITKHFPQLAEDGDDIWVCIRNPQTMAPEELRPEKVTVNADTGEVEETEENKRAGNEILAKIVIGWHAYDATWPIEVDSHGNVISGDAPALPHPATGKSVAKLPTPIYLWMGEMLQKANPLAQPEPPADGTSKTS